MTDAMRLTAKGLADIVFHLRRQPSINEVAFDLLLGHIAALESELAACKAELTQAINRHATEAGNWDAQHTKQYYINARLEKERDALAAKCEEFCERINLLYKGWDEGGLLHGDDEHKDNLTMRLREIFRARAALVAEEGGD